MRKDDLDYIHRYEIGSGTERSTTLLLLHGMGGSEDDLIDIGRSLLPGANLLSPRGKVNEGGMARFFRRIAEGVLDLKDLKERTTELDSFLDAASEFYGFPRRKVIAVGHSNGANIAASLLLSRPGELEGAVLFHPMLPYEPKESIDLSGVSIFIAAGRNDPLVSMESASRLAELLSVSGATVFTRFKDGGHELSYDEIEAARKWINEGDKPWN